MENHNCRTVISRYLVRMGVRAAALALLSWGWGSALAQFNQVQTNNNGVGGNSNTPNGGYDNGSYGGYGNSNGGYGNNYGGYGNGYGGYGNSYGGYDNGYGGMSSGFGSSGSGSSRLGSGSSHFGSGRSGSGSSRFGSSRSGSGSSRFGRNSDSEDTANSSDYQSRRSRNRDGSEQTGRNSKNKTSKTKKGKAGATQTQQSTRAMGKDNVSQRKTSSGGKGGGGAEAVPLPELKFDPKLIEDTLYFSPSFANVSPGDQFITTLAFFNQEQHKIDEIDLWIKYNPEQVAPVWADTSKLKEMNPGPIESRVWAGQGYMHLTAKLGVPPKGFASDLVDIYWRALTPTLESRIELAGPEGKSTAVLEAGKNVIEGGKLANSQKLGASITITPGDWAEPGLRTASQVDNMMPPAPMDKDKRLRLAIVSPKKTVATGEVSTADVMLLNPSGLAFDDLKMRIRFNPDEVTILDADQENFIADGLNIYDGSFHQQFPFDGHVRNLVDLDHGTIEYQVGSVMGPRVFPTGSFARIVYRMKRNAGKTAFWFETEDPLLHVRQTDVTAWGRSLLGDGTEMAAQALHGLEIAVKPLDLTPLDRKFEELKTTAQVR